MSYITLAEVKRWLNIDFNTDDLVLAEMAEGAENAIAYHLNRTSLDDLADASTGELPAALKTAIKTLVATHYTNREGIAYANPYKIPYTLEYCLQPFKNYDVSTYA